MPQGTNGHVPGWRRTVPGAAVLIGYRRAWLRGDLLAGVTVTAYLVPQVMAYAGVAGLPGLLIYRYDSPLFFANAEDFRRRALAAVDEQTGPVRWFVLNTEANVEVDITALDAVDGLRRELTRRGIVFALARVKQDLLDDLTAYGLTDSVGPDLIFPTLPTAVTAYRSRSPDQ